MTLLHPTPLAPKMLFAVLFLAFAVLAIRAGQRLIEQTALLVEPLQRQAALSRSALFMGCLAWSLDLAGYLAVPQARAEEARLAPALLALLVAMGTARVAIPAFLPPATRLRRSTAALTTALGTLATHLLVARAFDIPFVPLRPWPALGAFGLTAVLVETLSWWHRTHPGGIEDTTLRRLGWAEALPAAFGFLLIHRSLQAILPPPSHPAAGTGTPIALLLLLLAFAGVLGTCFTWSQNAERQRMSQFSRALSLVRSAGPPADPPQGVRVARIAGALGQTIPEGLGLKFQPISGLPLRTSGARLEALLRVELPGLGSIAPEEFFLACERAGRTAEADRALLELALKQSCPWRGLPGACLGISVNMAPDTLLDPGFLDWLSPLVADLPAGWLQIELTEHALVAAPGPLASTLTHLDRLGVRVVLDDFGAGFSSLGMLATLPIHGIKVDKSLVRGLQGDPTRRLILTHLCRMARDLGLDITAEGVETAHHLFEATACGATAIQGYLLAHPMEALETEGWLMGPLNRDTPSI